MKRITYKSGLGDYGITDEKYLKNHVMFNAVGRLEDKLEARESGCPFCNMLNQGFSFHEKVDAMVAGNGTVFTQLVDLKFCPNCGKEL